MYQFLVNIFVIGLIDQEPENVVQIEISIEYVILIYGFYFLSILIVNEPSASIRPDQNQGLTGEDFKVEENLFTINCLEGILSG